jgi:hypothetical protein
MRRKAAEREVSLKCARSIGETVLFFSAPIRGPTFGPTIRVGLSEILWRVLGRGGQINGCIWLVLGDFSADSRRCQAEDRHPRA